MVVPRKNARKNLFGEDQLIHLAPARGSSPAEQNDQELDSSLSKAGQGWLDDLTNLPNHAQFSYYLQQATLTARQRNKPLALLLIDLDRFHDIKATFGHQWGEVLLQQAGSRLRSTLRKSDLVARLGGGEFAVLLLTGGNEKAAVRVASRILHVLEQPFVIAGYAVDVGVSVGIALYSQEDDNAHAFMRRATVAAHMAEHAGSGYAFYSADCDPYNPDHLVLKADLRHAIKHDQLLLHYQPQVALATGRVMQAEALIRWQHPQHGLLLPTQFIPLAEQMGLMRQLGLWVLNTALRQCRMWQQEQIDLRVAVNLSMWDLQDAGLPDTLAQMCQSWHVAPDNLEVEIVESTLATDQERTVGILARLREMGVRIAIDDFGAGYSSLVYLKHLPVHTIKIDKCFVRDMQHERDAAIVRSAIDLGHALGLEVVAEGVEEKETCGLLATMGCDFAQGYYLSYPLPAREFTRWLQALPRDAEQRPVVRLPQAAGQYWGKERGGA